MVAQRKKRKITFRKLKNKFRLVIMNDETLEEKISFRLSPLNVFIGIGTIILTLITIGIYIIAFTPLKEYIPGYADVNMQRELVGLHLKADSLEKEVFVKDLFIQNIKNIVEGNVGQDTFNKNDLNVSFSNLDTIKTLRKSKEDSLLRAQIESESDFELVLNERKASSNNISSFFFFTPLKGTITNIFDPIEKHYGVDIVAPKNEAIKSTMDGTIVIASWTYETGYVIGVQHSNNLVSFYKHNSALLKKIGDFVKAGEVIAIIGSSGEFSSGPHLHFELWYGGQPINPQDYMLF